MGEVNFYLKKPEASGTSLIYLQFRFNGKKLVFSFGVNIDPRKWNRKKQRVKSNEEKTWDGKEKINNLLDELEKICINVYHDELKTGIPDPAQIKKHLAHHIKQKDNQKGKPDLYSLIERFILGEIRFKGRNMQDGSKDNYKALLKHFRRFEQLKKYRINFDTITLEFLYKFIEFLEHHVVLQPTTIAKEIRLIKRVMGEAMDLGLSTNLAYKHSKFTCSEPETDAVYLTEEEVISLYKFDFSKQRSLDRIRDLFVFGCFTGLRFSDFSTIKRENLVEMEGTLFIIKRTRKTNDEVIIPTHPIVLNLFDKYQSNDNRLPKRVTNQPFNRAIKSVCKMAGFNQKDRLRTNPEKELWRCITSHTARRSFATNMYLRGIPTFDIMRMTAHKTEKSFLKYIKVSKLETAKRVNEQMKDIWKGQMDKLARSYIIKMFADIKPTK